jgi:hypothetical protein
MSVRPMLMVSGEDLTDERMLFLIAKNLLMVEKTSFG